MYFPAHGHPSRPGNARGAHASATADLWYDRACGCRAGLSRRCEDALCSSSSGRICSHVMCSSARSFAATKPLTDKSGPPPRGEGGEAAGRMFSPTGGFRGRGAFARPVQAPQRYSCSINEAEDGQAYVGASPSGRVTRSGANCAGCESTVLPSDVVGTQYSCLYPSPGPKTRLTHVNLRRCGPTH